MSCCQRNGYQRPEYADLIRRLGEAGVEIPDGARIFGPGHGAIWRLVDMRGQPPEGIVAGRTPAKVLAAGPLEIRVGRDGRPMAYPAGRVENGDAARLDYPG